ncbi:MAG: NUDIX domain-containing protein [Patescibacteria group bacterium]
MKNIPKNIPEFGIKRENEERRDGGCAVIFDPESGLYAVGRHHDNGRLRLFSGGVEEEENVHEGIKREVLEESGLYDFQHGEEIGQALAHFYNSLKNVNRVALATCLLLVLRSKDLKDTKLEAHEKFSLYWATGEEILKNWQEHNQNKDVDHWIYFFEKAVARLKDLGYIKK